MGKSRSWVFDYAERRRAAYLNINNAKSAPKAGMLGAPPPPLLPLEGAVDPLDEEELLEELEDEELLDEDELLEEEGLEPPLEEEEELLVAGVRTSVETAPVARSTFRMEALPVSATKSVAPVESRATSRGLLNQAKEPRPSLRPAMPARPARVVTEPEGVIFRMVEFCVSAT